MSLHTIDSVGQLAPDTQSASADGATTDDGHPASDTRTPVAVVIPLPVGHECLDVQSRNADVGTIAAPPDPNVVSTPLRTADWAVLRILGDTHDDLMRSRIAIGNRLSRAAIDLDEVAQPMDLLEQAEKAAELKLKRAFRRTAPEIRAWVIDTPGLGEKLVARLLGVIGDPLWAEPMRWVDVAPEGHVCDPDRCGKRHLVALPPFKRTPGQLLQFCGHGSPDRRTKGMTQAEAMRLGNPRAKMLTHLIAESCMKCVGSEKRRQSPYRNVYEQYRAKYEGREDWTPLHQHNAAVRATGKAFLIDLWRVADGQEPRWPA